jgi:hypothetical protein
MHVIGAVGAAARELGSDPGRDVRVATIRDTKTLEAGRSVHAMHQIALKSRIDVAPVHPVYQTGLDRLAVGGYVHHTHRGVKAAGAGPATGQDRRHIAHR